MNKKNIGHIIFTTIEVAIVLAIVCGLFFKAFNFLSANLAIANAIIGALLIVSIPILIIFACSVIHNLDFKYQRIINHIFLAFFFSAIYLSQPRLLLEPKSLTVVLLLAGLIVINCILIPLNIWYNIKLILSSNSAQVLDNLKEILPMTNSFLFIFMILLQTQYWL